MKAFNLTVISLFCFFLSARSQEGGLFTLYGTQLVNDSALQMLSFNPALFRPVASVQGFARRNVSGKIVLHTTKKGKALDVYFFPGTSNKKALVIGGMHGSELSSIEVARSLIKKLSLGEKPYYNVVIVPTLFPDNAEEATREKKNRVVANTGRYTDEHAADPNRQMPPLGKPFREETPLDAMNRAIEGENAALLQLLQTYKPDRLISIHAIKDKSRAGVFADPRTDCMGNALGYDSDKALAILMAQRIQELGGVCPGNNLQTDPTALYYLDPPVAAEGQKQERSFDGSKGTGRGIGVSLGSWSSTAVCDADEALSRKAIRTFTMEFPGYLRPAEYSTEADRKRVEKLVQVYARSIHDYFLQAYFVEEEATNSTRFLSTE
ncbi:MAG TPA: hypothetical protein VGN63_22450 [Flavisolibacter sp.]|jgi:hypothetical protein|nr:hypothetical protein [Flavisolibacter sp.]